MHATNAISHATNVINAISHAIKLSGGMKRIFATKSCMPSRVMPSHPEEKRRRLGANGLIERPGPLQPGELERWYYGGGGGGCGGGGGMTGGGGGTLTTMDTNVAIIAAGTTPRGEGEGEEGAVALSGQ